MNKSFINKKMLCPSCGNPINKELNDNFIIKCSNCKKFNRFRHIEKQENKYCIKPVEDEFYKNEIDNGILYTYQFHLRDLARLKDLSLKTGQALEKFLYYDKESLNYQEKNILYKFKGQSIKEIEKKIEYLEVKKSFIELLNFLEF